MDEQRKRAARVLAYLERRTTANGCTEAEAEAARHKAAEIRERYKVEPDASGPDLDYLTPNRAFNDLADLFAAMAFEMIARGMMPRKATRGNGQKKARKRRAQAHAKAVRFRWRG